MQRTMDLIERLEEDGRITVIRPIRPIEVGRMEKDTAKLSALYQEGYEIAKKVIYLHSHLKKWGHFADVAQLARARDL